MAKLKAATGFRKSKQVTPENKQLAPDNKAEDTEPRSKRAPQKGGRR